MADFFGEENEVINPITRYLEWKGGEKDGYYQYRDKETSSNVKYDLKRFVMLKSPGLTFRGYSSKHGCGVGSTEIDASESKSKDIKVWAWTKPSSTEVAFGKYADIKGQLDSIGISGHGAFVVYDLDSQEVIEFFHKGTARWNINKELKEGKYNVIEVAKATSESSGTTKYKLAQFKNTGSSVEGDERARVLDAVEEVKNYYASKGRVIEEEVDSIVEQEVVFGEGVVDEIKAKNENPDDKLPF